MLELHPTFGYTLLGVCKFLIMRTIPLFSPTTTKLSWFKNKLQVWTNPSYGLEFHRHWYQDYDRIILRVGKLVICWTKVWD